MPRSGRRVSLYDAVPGAVERGLVLMEKSLAKLAEKGGHVPAEVLTEAGRERYAAARPAHRAVLAEALDAPR